MVRLSQIAHATESNPTAARPWSTSGPLSCCRVLRRLTLHAMVIRVATSFSARFAIV